MAQNEATITAPRRRGRKRVDRAAQIGDGQSHRDSREREVASVQRSRVGVGASGAIQRGDGFGKTVREKERAAQRPEVKGAARRGCRLDRSSQVIQRGGQIAGGEGRASRILVENIGQDVKRERLSRDLEGAREFSAFEESQGELPEQHGLSGRVEPCSRGQATASELLS
jgi:hypothetical protein